MPAEDLGMDAPRTKTLTARQLAKLSHRDRVAYFNALLDQKARQNPGSRLFAARRERLREIREAQEEAQRERQRDIRRMRCEMAAWLDEAPTFEGECGDNDSSEEAPKPQPEAAGGGKRGQARYGFRRDSTQLDELGNPTFVPVPAEQELLDKVASLRHSGASWEGVTRILNSEGYRTRKGGRWIAATVRRTYLNARPGVE